MGRSTHGTRRGPAGIIAAVLLPAMVLAIVPHRAAAQDTTSISIEEALRIGASRNIGLLRAGYAIRAARARVVAARGAFQPNLTVTASPGVRYQFGSSSNNTTTQQDHASASFSLGASSSYALYSGGADRAALNEAEQSVTASDLTYSQTAQSTAFGIITSYYDIATARALIDVARRNLEAERTQLERVQAFTDAQTRPISDLYTEQAVVAAAESRLYGAQRDFEVAKLGLIAALRLDPLGRYDFPASDSSLLAVPLPTSDAELVTLAMAQRPEIAAQQARIEAATESIRAAEAGSSPTLSLNGSIGSSYSSQDHSTDFAPQLFSQNPGVSFGLSLAIPVFDRDRTSSAEELARIAYQEELLTMTELRLQTAVSVRQALLDMSTAAAQLAAVERQFEAARQAVEVEQARYETGVSTLTELTQARARSVEAEGSVIAARNTVAERRASLLVAIGAITTTRREPEIPTEEELHRR